MPGSCTYVGGNTTKGSSIQFYGIFKREEQLDDLRKISRAKYKYRNRKFWCRGYYVDTAGKNAKKIEEYIRRQLDGDKAGEQLTMGNF